jgi:hypothetical protein
MEPLPSLVAAFPRYAAGVFAADWCEDPYDISSDTGGRGWIAMMTGAILPTCRSNLFVMLI